MPRPTIHTECDRCHKEDTLEMVNLESFEATPYWKPKGWNVHTEVGADGDIVVTLCSECESEFQTSVKEFSVKK